MVEPGGTGINFEGNELLGLEGKGGETRFVPVIKLEEPKKSASPVTS
jgi:hypothetical protein